MRFLWTSGKPYMTLYILNLWWTFLNMLGHRWSYMMCRSSTHLTSLDCILSCYHLANLLRSYYGHKKPNSKWSADLSLLVHYFALSWGECDSRYAHHKCLHKCQETDETFRLKSLWNGSLCTQPYSNCGLNFLYWGRTSKCPSWRIYWQMHLINWQ